VDSLRREMPSVGPSRVRNGPVGTVGEVPGIHPAWQNGLTTVLSYPQVGQL
jgi:hypothetical protein